MIGPYLNQQTNALAGVNDRETLRAWHQGFAEAWGLQASVLAASANATFGLAGDRQVRDEVGYLVAESAPSDHAEQAWTLLSANPGWCPETNALERPLKGQGPGSGPIDHHMYQSFRGNYSPRWYQETVQPVNPAFGQWWNKALNFLHDCAAIPRARGMAGRDPRLDVLGWELWPFHSNSDGMTGVPKGTRALLDVFASASIAAAARFQADRAPIHGIVLASTTGFERLADQLPPETKLGEAGHVVGIAVRRYTVGAERPLWAIRRQLFARPVPAATMLGLVAWIRGGQLSPEMTGETLASASQLYSWVSEVLGPCACAAHGTCPTGWHKWLRVRGPDARAFADRNGPSPWLKLNLPSADVAGERCIAEFEFEANQVFAGGAWQMDDDRSSRMTRYRLRISANNEEHLAFLRRWLCRTIND